jgi:hypothetical protein
MANLRSKSVTMKLTEEEYARLEARAGGRPLGEWTRELVLREGRPVDEILLAEMMALRTIVLNVARVEKRGEEFTDEYMLALVASADDDKLRQAREWLEEAAQGKGPRRKPTTR